MSGSNYAQLVDGVPPPAGGTALLLGELGFDEGVGVRCGGALCVVVHGHHACAWVEFGNYECLPVYEIDGAAYARDAEGRLHLCAVWVAQ
jgi:hypothetical protein